jgi:hypothetical protein
MDPARYLLLEGAAFTIPPDLGPMAIFPNGAAVARTAVKTTQAKFDRDKNYYLSYKNIMRACFRMLDANVSAQFKVLNNPTLTGWNSTMSIINILSQLQVSYGKPNMMMLYTNDTLFRSLMTAGGLPEMLFYRIEQCQEIQCISNLPYSEEQIIAKRSAHPPPSQHIPPKRIQRLGCRDLENISGPQDVHPCGLWLPPYCIGTSQHIRPERICQPDDLQRHGRGDRQ